MSSTGRDIAVGRVDGDMYPDLIAIDATQITLRLGDGAGGFGPASTTALRDGRAGPASIVDLDNNGLLDVLVVLGANADTFDIALANTSGGWNTSTISLAAGERALGIIGVNALRLTSTPRDIVVLVESPAGRLLRLYASHLVGGYSATDSFDSTDPALADIVVPVIWAATTTVAGREVLGASVTGPGPLWIELSGSQVVHVGTNRPTVAPPWLRAVEGAPVYKYDASNVQSAAFAVTTDAGFGIAFRTDTADITSEPIDSNTAWFDAVGGTPLVIAAHGTQLETGGAWYRPPIAQLPFAPTTLRVADLNVDGFPDLVIANNAAAAALLAAGHLE